MEEGGNICKYLYEHIFLDINEDLDHTSYILVRSYYTADNNTVGFVLKIIINKKIKKYIKKFFKKI